MKNFWENIREPQWRCSIFASSTLDLLKQQGAWGKEQGAREKRDKRKKRGKEQGARGKGQENSWINVRKGATKEERKN